jgi:hypothetical protein
MAKKSGQFFKIVKNILHLSIPSIEKNAENGQIFGHVAIYISKVATPYLLYIKQIWTFLAICPLFFGI